MKKYIIFAISVIIGLALFIGVLFNVGPGEIFETCKQFSWWEIIVILFLVVAILVVSAYRWWFILFAQGYRIPFSKVLAAKLAGFTVSYLTPSAFLGGEAIRGYILKREAGVKMRQGMASIIIDKFLDFSVALPFLFIALVFLMIKFSLPGKIVLGILIIFIFLGLLLYIFYSMAIRGRGFFSTIIKFTGLRKIKFLRTSQEKMMEMESAIYQFFKYKKNYLYFGFFTTLVIGVLTFFLLKLTLSFFGFHLDILQVAFAMTFGAVAFIFPVPASLGVQETSQALIFNFMKIGADVGVAFSLVIRVTDMIKVIFGLVILSHLGIKLTQTMVAKKNGESNEENKRLDMGNGDE